MFGKLFGWRKKQAEVDTDEPPTAVRPTARPAAAPAVPADKKAKGFDPYNSGAFKRQNAWEKIPRL